MEKFFNLVKAMGIIFLMFIGIFLSYEIHRIIEINEKILLLEKENQHLRSVSDTMLSETKDLDREIDRQRGEISKLQKELREARIPISRGMSIKDFRRITEGVLKYLEVPQLEIPAWTDLLVFTAQAESDFGRCTKQRGGPAVGILQVEPATAKEIWRVWMPRNPEYAKKTKSLMVSGNIPGIHQMEYNMAYSIAMGKALYTWRGVKNPRMKLKTVGNLWVYYKTEWNTYKGASTREKNMQKMRGIEFECVSWGDDRSEE